MTPIEILEVAGYEECTQEKFGKGWELWSAKLRHVVEETTTKFIFFNSSASWTSIEEARKTIHETKETHAVVQNSAKISNELGRIEKSLETRSARTFRDFLAHIIMKSMERKHAEVEEIKYYVDPDIIQVDTQVKERAFKAIESWLNDTSTKSPRLGIVLGKPGVGKTTFAKNLYHEFNRNLKKYRRVPLIIISDQWSRFGGNSTITLWDIWKEALMYSSIGDQRERLFECCAKSGAIIPVFDGFDELCTLWPHQFNPNEILNTLLDLFKDEDGKILLMSRDVFFEENIPVQLHDSLRIFELQPFNKQQLAKYLEVRFPADFQARDRARNLLLEYQKIAYSPMTKYPPSELRLGNVPVVVDLLSQCAEDPANASVNPQSDPILDIIRMLCRREKRRQGIEADEEIQIAIFKELAISFESPFSESDLELCAKVMSEEFQDTSKMKALHSHPLIDRRNGSFVFRYEFMPAYFAALHTSDLLLATKPEEPTVRIFQKYGSGVSGYYDYLAQTLWGMEGQKSYETLRYKLLEATSRLMRNKLWRDVISTVMTHLFLRLMTMRGDKVTAKERSTELQELLGMHGFRSIRFSGVYNTLDFRDSTFVDCVFADVTFVGCSFSANTAFAKCRFCGRIQFQNCSGVKTISRIDNCTLDPIARDALNGVIDGIGIDKNQVERWMTILLKKFRSGIYFVNQGRPHLVRGLIINKITTHQFLDYFVRSGLVVGVKGEAGDEVLFHVPREERGDVVAFLENGMLSGKVKALFELLSKNLCS